MPICCICLKQDEIFLNINSNACDEITLIEKLRSCMPNEQWHEEFFICNDCIEKLETAYVFTQLCLISEFYRKQQSQEIQRLNDIPKFVCHNCNKSFRLKRTLSLHLTRIHNNNPKKSLSIKTNESHENDDDDQSAIKNEINQYLNNIDDQENDNDDLNSINSFIVSEKDDENDSNYSSNESSTKNRKKDMRKKRCPRLKGPKKCDFCELIFTRNDRYAHHVRSKHTFEKPFGCNLCDARYSCSHNLNIHMRKHRNEKPYICSTCGKSFISSNDLWQHNKIHDRIRQYPCDMCERSFKTHSNLRTHKLQMHQDPVTWKFICTVCGKKFPLNNNLIKHMRRHEGIKQFCCQLCEKRFVEKIDLQSHLLSHSNERLFKCHLCTKEYKKRETLRRHLKSEHEVGNYQIKKPEKKFHCPICPKIFPFNNKLQRHILTHTGEKPVKCDYCDKRFRDNYDRNVHIKKSHNIEPKNFC